MRYEYKCIGCGQKQELNQPVAARDQAPPCKRCGAWTKRLLSAPSIQFKGEGWTPRG